MSPLDGLRESLLDPRPVYVVVGEEGLLVREGADLVRAAVLSGATAAFNDAVFAAGELRGPEFADTARTAPMMAARRLVSIRQVDDASASVLDAVLDYVQNPVSSTVLLITGTKFPAASGGMDRGARIVNAVRKCGFVTKLDGGVDPAGFVASRAAALGCRMDPDATRLLVEYAGTDLAILDANVEKCAGYVGGGATVTRAVVEEVCVHTAEAAVWSLTDAIVNRNAALALSTLHRLLEEGEAPHRLLANCAWQLRQVLALQDTIRRGLPEREANVRMPPDKARAIRARIQRSPLSPSAVLEGIAAVNQAMNSSRAGDRRVFESWIVRLCTA